METQSLKCFKKLVAEVQVSYNKLNQLPSVKVSCSSDVSNYIRKVFPVELDLREAFMCLFLNRANNVQGFAVISIGGISGTVADPKVIFQHALLCNASSIILIHNHPSGNLKPSHADIQLTKKLKLCGDHLDLPVLDHLIITSESYFSFADEGLL